MAKSSILLAILVLTICVSLSYQQCPPSSKVTQCSPKCLQDTECATLGGKCCPNLCNYKSCVLARGNDAANNNKYASSASGGAYCGNVKCNSFEKCGMDSSKRQKCVRA